MHEPAANVTTTDTTAEAARSFVQAQLSPAHYGIAFGESQWLMDEDALLVIVATEVAARQARLHAHPLLALWCDDHDVARFSFVVDGRLTLLETPVVAELPSVRQNTSRVPTSLVARFIAERGFWSLGGSDQQDLIHRAVDREGWVEIHRAENHPVPDVFALSAYNAIVSIWAAHDRADATVHTSYRELLRAMGLSEGGKNSAALEASLRSLAATMYQLHYRRRDGGADDATGGPPSEILFHLVDQVKLWQGPQQASNRRVEITLGSAVHEVLCANYRLLRPADSEGQRLLSPQQVLARRLLVYLDGARAHARHDGHETIQRIIDQPLAEALGIRATRPSEIRRRLEKAMTAIVAASDVYTGFQIRQRTAKGLRRGDPSEILVVTRVRRRRPAG